MSMDYIRSTYAVPAKRGARIRYTDSKGRTHEGTITSARGGKLRARMDRGSYWTDARRIALFHPTWCLEYL